MNRYEELLDRMYSLLVANNPELAGDRKRFLMKPPQVVREGSKRVVRDPCAAGQRLSPPAGLHSKRARA